jgi:hypothetical protein
VSVPFATFRPIDKWAGELTEARRYSQFSASWPDTLHLLKRELEKLDAENIIVQLALREDQIRQDGFPRAGVSPDHPGVILAFDSRYGPLKYATDVFTRWEANIRAIALGLEALRKVDRYGITKRGEQYTGWKALPETAGYQEDWLVERGEALIAEYGTTRDALMATHPDRGGDPDDFRAVQAARDA